MVKQHDVFHNTTHTQYHVLPPGFSCTPFSITHTPFIGGMQHISSWLR